MTIIPWRRKKKNKRTDAKAAIERAETANSDLARQRSETRHLSARLRALRHENHFEPKIRAAMEGGHQ
ncbi:MULTISPECIES: hypothetical protein [Streptomyces]|uniref:DUF7620 family protein n=1 Tax=Streptomyces TaxID=1883 RepID=UPI000E08B392|nr:MULTISPECIES: hypothetical protein [Streptomyces]MBT3077665.1 hypothetical protein [Streptomyces sp. COG21]MBT3084510.1 hypothetical protein [Streptomyces sp. COG20]MBT3085416.1 hypothetical protein [Streptomyces sp. CYG21]MBT3099010.1 hypothetical protein [Streptomyces sp. CBG30]MBT3103541.1 hypothetical protein [Streptomyces sp. COG19]